MPNLVAEITDAPVQLFLARIPFLVKLTSLSHSESDLLASIKIPEWLPFSTSAVWPVIPLDVITFFSPPLY